MRSRIPLLTLLISLSAALPCRAEEAAVTNTPLETIRADGEKMLLVDDFDRGLTHGLYTQRGTTLGAYHGTFAKRPSYSTIEKTTREQRTPQSGKALVLEWERKGGWCGYYTLLNDGNDVPADASPYNALCFWVKGARGGEHFDIGFADKRMVDLEVNAKYAGDVASFLPDGVTTNWQEVKVPLSRIASEVDLQTMGSLVFFFREEGKGKVFVDDLVFRNDESVTQQEEYNMARATKTPGHPRTLWVWKIDPVNNLRARTALLDFCERTAIELIYQYFGELEVNNPEYVQRLEAFLRECHERGVKVEGLTGDPTWCFTAKHYRTLDWIEQFLEWNKDRPQEERFDGISLDVEPYLTSEWQSDRDSIKKQYIELLKKCSALIESYDDEHFHWGAAVPVGYREEEARDGFVTKILEQVDYLALMNYYDKTSKMISGAKEFIEWCANHGARIWLGVETQDLISMKQGNAGNTFWDDGWVRMEQVLAAVHEHYKDAPGYGGIAMHCYYSYRITPRDRVVPLTERPYPDDSDAYEMVSLPAPDKMKINGDLEEWRLDKPFTVRGGNHVVYGKGNWEGDEDLSATAYSMYDEEHLYFAFDITDNAVFQDATGEAMWKGDHIELWIDADLLGDYYEAVTSDDDFQFGLSPGNFDDVRPEVFVFTPTMGEDYHDEVKIGAQKSDKGYRIEIAIPKAFMLKDINARIAAAGGTDDKSKAQLIEIGPGKRVGLCIDPSDCDSDAQPQKCLMSSSVNRAWGNPTTFGFLRLAEED